MRKEKNKGALKLGIIGHGFVGKAMDFGFSINVEKFIVDPQIGTNIDQLKNFSPQIAFICVPTPMDDDGSQDSSIIESVVSELIQKCPDVTKVIKSTVVPNVLDRLHDLDNKIIYNPEFLREKHADDDFVNSKNIIIAGDKEGAEKVSLAYLNHSICKTKSHYFTDIKTASLVKFTINTFLATKVIFFNEMFELLKKNTPEANWPEFINLIKNDERIGSSHMDVPGHDNRKGFGGACFPKDSLALLKYAKGQGIELSLLKNAVKKNNAIRSQYNELDARETEQNVSFDDRI